MKVLVFHIGRERYALPLAAVLRVLPVARLKPLPGAPHYVPGLLDLHGEPVPVIDLSRLAGSPPDAIRYDTRILLLDVPALGKPRRLGLKAEHVAGVADIDAALREGGVAAAPWLGAVAPGGAEGGGMLQLIAPERLLAPEVAALLFGGAAA
ncbi:Chemotaxis protein CheW [Massilia sp. Bi118]|uniref:chemotaxis protein CheW n=1 Tax=Massilia sp. Bi118 TaxID=2822346 RepID=UPI001DC358C7|nr:chemotaxis protein CheW [Massilia sp. Bi118]CAH0286470.1 Chemotaxis protein CheW [Massilia sp. Bi118]